MHPAPRIICMLVYPQAQSLDICGPLEVFALASRQAQDEELERGPLYSVRLLAATAAPVELASGMRLLPDATYVDMPADTDTLLICGGMGDALDRVRADTALVTWLREASSRVRRVASICSGALLLAEAGLLNDREATTHWSDVPELRDRYPAVRVLPDAIYTRDGPVWTSAGITTGMDLALAMVSADHSDALALKVARRMVMASKRSGGQSQFSEQLNALEQPELFAALATWIADNLRLRLDVAALAGRVHMSPRQFTRRFSAHFGLTPQKYVERLRVEAAKPLLESTAKNVKRIATECGFPSDEAMRRAFLRQLGHPPSDYRDHFSAA